MKKASFGDPDRVVRRTDILQTCDLMRMASMLAFVLCAMLRLILTWPPLG